MADRDILPAVNRFGLGARPGELAEVARDPRGWALSLLDRAPEPLPPGVAPTADAGMALAVSRIEALDRRREEDAAAGMAANGADGAMAPARRRPRDFVSGGNVLEESLAARVEVATRTAAPLHERLAQFWLDHFTISTGGGQTAYFSDAYEREAIRPHLLGRFADMARAAVLHPAMIYYLDNRSSVGPNSALGRRRGRRRGLNENLGREALELHTVGVDGGYGQEDVIALAKVLTGWGARHAPNTQGPRFGFFPDLHEPGPKTVLGRTYRQDGADQAIAVLDDLSRHPSTARHVGRRLVQHVVGQGLPGLEARIAETFRRTDGDLRAVTRALIADDEAWGPPRKVRPPIELVFSAARMMGGLPPQPAVGRALQVMGQPYLRAPSPKGWPAENEAWAAPDAIKTRLDWASELASRLPPRTDARALLEAALGPGASAETRRAIERAADGRQAVTLLLLSPEFQRR